jgi:hypothetical protein
MKLFDFTVSFGQTEVSHPQAVIFGVRTGAVGRSVEAHKTINLLQK